MVTMDTRVALLKAAEELFASQGFSATSVKEICDQAGVNVSLVSYYFESKEGLYREVLSRFGAEGLAIAERVLSLPQSREEFRVRLQMFASEVVRKHADEPRLTKILHREIQQKSSPVQEVFQATFHKVFERLFGFIRHAQEAGYVKADLDPLLVTGLFVGAVFHQCNTDELRCSLYGLTIQDESFRNKLVDHAIRVFLEGIGT